MLVRIFNNIEECIVAPLMALMSILVFLQVLSRFALHIPMPWIEELLRICFIWTIMLSASIGIKRKAHLGVTMLMTALPRPAQAVFFYCGTLVIVATCCVFISATWDIILMQKASNQSLITMPVPIYCSTLILPVGFVLIIVRTLQMAVKARQGDYF